MGDRTLPGPRVGLRGSVRIPTSKSQTNRGLMMAAVAGGGTVIDPLDCEDTRLLAGALAGAGWGMEWLDAIGIGARKTPAAPVEVWLGNSGTGCRLLAGLLAASPGRVTVDGTARLRERPMRPLLEVLDGLGARCESADGYLPLTVDGRRLDGGRAKIRPEVSSQFVSALLLAAPLMRRGLDLEVEGEFPSQPYVDLTVDVLRAFGGEVEVDANGRRWRVPPDTVRPSRYEVEGDWSAAAFMLAAAAVAGGEVRVGPLLRTSRQGDRIMAEILERAGVTLQTEGSWLKVVGPAIDALDADLSDAPDLFPALAVVAASVPPGSRLTGLGNLRHKESDRLSAMVDNLGRLGARFEVDGETLVVGRGMDRGTSEGTAVNAVDDHRIAMAMAVAALVAGPLRLDNPDCVAKSFPGFWESWQGLIGDEAGAAR